MSVSALIHIGSASVSGGLVDGQKLVFAAERETRWQEKLEPSMFLNNVAEALKIVLADLLAAKLGSPEKVIIFLSSPFVAGQLNFLTHKEAKPFRVTEKLVGQLTLAEAAKFSGDPQHQVVDSKIVRFRLNGYEVAAPHGQKTSELELAQYLSISGDEVVQKFGAVIHAACHHEHLEWHSAVFAAFSVVRRQRPADHSFLLVDISGELTELTIIADGLLHETFSFPIGYQALAREITTAQGTTSAEAKSALDLHLDGSQAPTTAARLRTDLLATKKSWLENFATGLKQIIDHRFWSGEIILLGENESFLSYFDQWLGEFAFGQVVFGTPQTKRQILTRAVFGRWLNQAPEVKPSLPLLLETIFLLK